MSARKHCAWPLGLIGMLGIVAAVERFVTRHAAGWAHTIVLDWRDTGRVRYTSVDDKAALEGFTLCSRLEGILPALETAHSLVTAMEIAAKRDKNDIVVLCFSGRGDKDCAEVARLIAEAK